MYLQMAVIHTNVVVVWGEIYPNYDICFQNGDMVVVMVAITETTIRMS